MKAARVCRRAADLIEAAGWCQQRGRRLTERRLSLPLALRIAAAEVLEEDRGTPAGTADRFAELADLVSHARRAVLAQLGEADWHQLITWNDQPARTADEVVEVLLATAGHAGPGPS